MCEVPITIGLCVKNCSDTILETLKCIIDQEYPRKLMEIIVVDDESTDDTVHKILGTLSQTSINFKILSTGGRGLGYARQLVVEKANGKYIVWIDGDMILPKNHVKLQVSFMEENSDVGKARAKWQIMSEKTLPAKLESLRLLHINNPKSINVHLTGIGGSICRTEALKAIEGFDKRIRGAGEDIDLTIRLAKFWKVSISNAIFYHVFRKTWKGLWQQYYWYGYGMHYVNSKNRGVIHIWKYLPHVAFLAGLLQALTVFKLTKQKIAFLLPLQYIFKYSAWLNGYVRSHLDGYEYGLHNRKV